MKVALIEAKPSKNKYSDLSFEYERFALCSDSSIKKIRKSDVDLLIDVNEYDWVVLVGSEPFEFFTKRKSITDYSGKVIDDKFIPLINPAMLKFKPEAKPTWVKSVESANSVISGAIKPLDLSKENKNYEGITTKKRCIEYLNEALAHSNKFFALDCETSALYCRNGYVLGISISFKKDYGAYIDSDIIDDEVCALLQRLIDEKTVIFHNSKFDIVFISHYFGLKFNRYEDTMLIHYCLDENPGTHGLKQLALRYTDYGDYEKDLEDWINNYKKATGVTKDNFSYDLIPFDVMVPYASIDSIVTLILYSKLLGALNKNDKLVKVYREILLPANDMIIDMQENGVPMDKERLDFAHDIMGNKVYDLKNELMNFPEIRAFEEKQGKEFNPASTLQLRSLLFDHLRIPPTGKKTDKGEHSTDAEVLGLLSEVHPVPATILKLRKISKSINTYIDKIIPNLDRDGRLRTNFNLHGTVAGRLSSSGKMNMQQLPRDESAVKGSIKAKEGYKIVSMDLQTAEVYIAAVLSGDKELQGVFTSGGDFHSTIAKRVFKLPCNVEDVKKLFPDLRQAAKTVTFAILYQAGAYNVFETVNKDIRDKNLDMSFSLEDAEEAINRYFREFPKLKKWIDSNKSSIAKNGYTYSFFGRKRRLPNVKSDNQGVKAHAVRSGLNFLVQSPASDVNLLGAADMHKWLKKNPSIDAKIFALVHDSIVAEVKDEHIEEYCKALASRIQKNRGLSIPNCPINCDFEAHQDYSMGKFDKAYGEEFEQWRTRSR